MVDGMVTSDGKIYSPKPLSINKMTFRCRSGHRYQVRL